MQHRIKTAGIRVVGIDERALAGHCQWPGPRHRLAKIVETLRDLGAAVIVFDVLFAEPDRMSPSNLIADPAVRKSADGKSWLGDLAAIDPDVTFAAAMRTAPVTLGIPDAGLDDPLPHIPVSGHVAVGGDPAAGLFALSSNTSLVPVLKDASLGICVVNISPASIDGTVREVPLIWRMTTLRSP